MNLAKPSSLSKLFRFLKRTIIVRSFPIMKEKISTPESIMMAPRILSLLEIGCRSPKPTVVRVVKEK